MALTILYEVENIGRFKRVQQFCSYARLVKGQKVSAGKRLGTMGAKMGNRHLKWAFPTHRRWVRKRPYRSMMLHELDAWRRHRRLLP